MSTFIEFESPRHEWRYDSLYGVGCFRRKSDGATTFLETGTDCQEVRRSLRRLDQKTQSKRYPKTAPGFDSVFDSIATEYTFYPE